MNELCKDLEQNQKFLELIEDIKNNTSPITISGLSDVGEAQFISAIKDETKKNICIITYNELQAKRIARDLKYFYDNVEIFPKREIATYDYLVESKDLPYERIDVLNKIITNTKCRNDLNLPQSHDSKLNKGMQIVAENGINKCPIHRSFCPLITCLAHLVYMHQESGTKQKKTTGCQHNKSAGSDPSPPAL